VNAASKTSRDDFHRKNARALLEKAERELEQSRATRSSPTRLPMLLGVFDFPWRPGTLLCWLSISLGFTVSVLLLAFLMGPAAALGMMGVRLIGPAAFGILLFTLAYMFACCQKVIEETAYGHAVIDEWPSLVQWKEWGWAFFQLFLYVLQSALAAAVLTAGSWLVSPIPVLLVTAILFPFFLLSCLESDSWIPLSWPIIRSLQTHTPVWGLFYLEAAGVVVGWGLVTLAGIEWFGLFSFFVSGPLLAAAALICARLLGRLAWCIRRP